MVKKQSVNREVFAERLKILMNENNETVYTIGEIVHLSAATISRYINAEMSPKITTVEVLARYFNVNPVWLLGYSVPKKLPQEVFENSAQSNSEIEEDIFTKAAHKVGHEGPLTDEEKEKIALAIKIALAKNNK